MKRRAFAASAFFVVVLAACPAMAIGAGDRASDLVRKADEYRAPSVPYSALVRVSDAQGSDAKKSAFRVFSNGKQNALVEQLEPERLKRRKLLMREHDLWLWSPNSSRPTRISFEQKLTGEVANGDLMRTNFSDDYDAETIGEEAVDGQPAYKLRLKAKNKEVTYRSVEYWIAKATLQPLKAVFFALSGKPLKTATYSEFKPQLGRPRLTKVVIVDALQKDRSSTLTYSSFKKEDLGDAFFSKEALSQ